MIIYFFNNCNICISHTFLFFRKIFLSYLSIPVKEFLNNTYRSNKTWKHRRRWWSNRRFTKEKILNLTTISRNSFHAISTITTLQLCAICWEKQKKSRDIHREQEREEWYRLDPCEWLIDAWPRAWICSRDIFVQIPILPSSQLPNPFALLQ